MFMLNTAPAKICCKLGTEAKIAQFPRKLQVLLRLQMKGAIILTFEYKGFHVNFGVVWVVDLFRVQV